MLTKLHYKVHVFLMFIQNLAVKSSLPFLVLVPDESAWKLIKPIFSSKIPFSNNFSM